MISSKAEESGQNQILVQNNENIEREEWKRCDQCKWMEWWKKRNTFEKGYFEDGHQEKREKTHKIFAILFLY